MNVNFSLDAERSYCSITVDGKVVWDSVLLLEDFERFRQLSPIEIRHFVQRKLGALEQDTCSAQDQSCLAL